MTPEPGVRARSCEGAQPVTASSSHLRLIVRSSARDSLVTLVAPRRLRAAYAPALHSEHDWRPIVEDLTRFGLFLISVPVVVVASGVLLGVIGRVISRRRDG